MPEKANSESHLQAAVDLIAAAAEWATKEPCDTSRRDVIGYCRESLTAYPDHVFRNFGGYARVRAAHFPPKATPEAKTIRHIQLVALDNNRIGRAENDEALHFERIEKLAARVFKGRLPPLPKRKRQESSERETVICIGDTHWGSDIAANETGAQNYGPAEEARRMARVVEQVCEYKTEHRKNTALRVVLLGDLIHGCLHDTRDGAVLAEQQSRAIHLLIQAIGRFAAAFGRVTVECVTGNHGRDKSRHESRATVGKWDSRETVIYSAAHMATSNLDNVEWNIPRSSFAVFKVFGKKYFVTHGDGVINVGSPGRSIQVATIEGQLNRLNATLRDRDEYAVAIVGHVHQSAILTLGNGMRVIVNGPFTPVEFSDNVRGRAGVSRGRLPNHHAR